jgi:anthranilate/para-aminobenzoate synthase component I
MDAQERDKMLEDITKTSHRDLDDELKRKHAEIKDQFRREQTKLQDEFKKEKANVGELLDEQFNQAINRLKESIKNGDYEGEIAHRMTADWLNSELKKRGY